MHSMHKGFLKRGGRKSVAISDGYCYFALIEKLIWEQGVGGSNPLAPTNKLS
jgi:hypothetical protein